jgi:pimeloyl-ACP methyl ester carboxylesterase
MDVRGHGRSGAPHDPGAYGLEMVDDVVRLMDHLELPRAHVAAYSMGGFITLRLLTRHPDRVLRAAPCGFGWQRPDPSPLNVYDTLASAFERGFGFSVLTAFLNPGSGGGPLRASLMDLAAAAFVDQGVLSTVARSFPELTVSEAELRAVDVPVLSIIGSDDPLKPGVDAMVGLLPRHEVVVVAGGTHRFTPRAPLFREALHRFLRGEPAA